MTMRDEILDAADGLGSAGSSKERVSSVSLNLDDVKPDDRLACWRNSLSNAYALTVPAETDGSQLIARKQVWVAERMILMRRECSEHSLERSIRLINADSIDHYKLHLRVSVGTTEIETGKRLICLNAGECAVTDMAQFTRTRIAAGTTIVVILPRRDLDKVLARPADLHGVMLRGAASRLFAEQLQSLVSRMNEVTRAEMRELTQAMLYMLAACLAPSLAMLEPACQNTMNSVRDRICHFIEGQLTRPDLSMEQICKEFHLSRSTLYRLFQHLGGVASYLKERRLIHIHRLLSTSRSRMSLARVAEHYGFQSQAHFSRVFRDRFGYSPRELMTDARMHVPLGPGGEYALERYLKTLA